MSRVRTVPSDTYKVSLPSPFPCRTVVLPRDTAPAPTTRTATPELSFAPRDQLVKLCLGCERLFRTSNTQQTCCSFACATGGHRAADD